MKSYFVSKKPEPDGVHEVHHQKCLFIPRNNEDIIFLGEFEDCRGALGISREHFKETKGCFFCSYECSSKNPDHVFSTAHAVPAKPLNP